MIKTPNQLCMQNLSQISGPVCPQLFDLASFLQTIAFDKVEPTLERGNFIKSLDSGKIVRYIHHRELVIESIAKRAKLRKFSPHVIMVRKNPFKKLEYHVVSNADIEIFSVENNRLTNVLLTDGCLGRHLRLTSETN